MNIILTGGGTAGHVSPAIAVAEEIMQSEPDSRILFIGREGGGENEAVTKAGLKLKTLKIQGLKRKLTPENIKRVAAALSAERDAREILRDFKPDVVLGTGGYVCWPVLRAAVQLGIPTAIHESNAKPGLTTRLLARRCDLLLLNHKEAAEKLKKYRRAVTVGNPLRRSFKKTERKTARAQLGIRDGETFILSVGGSIGAEKLNDTVIEVMEEFSVKEKDIKHIHATGKRYFDSLKASKLAKGYGGCKIIPYIEDMATMLSAADIVISRAGAITLSEIAAVGTTPILIPSPNVSGNHQFENAKRLSDAGAAVLIEEKYLTPEELKNAIIRLKNQKNERKNVAKRISAFYSPDAAKRIKNELKKVVFSKKGSTHLKNQGAKQG